MVKVQISMQEDLLNKIDDFAKSNFMNRSAFISMVCNQYLQAKEVTEHLKDLTFSVRKIADGQEVDTETMQKIEDFERLAKVLNFKD